MSGQGMGRRVRKTGAEQDVASRYWRSRLVWTKGETAKIKRQMRRRERRDGKREARGA